MSHGGGPRVSVIVPVFDSMPYLTGTMRSLLEQDLPRSELEIIAIDDGSTDGSGEELDRWASRDPRVSVLHQPNSGWPGMPRNRGLERARGEYVFFADSDDELAPDALRLMVEMAHADGADVVIPRMQGTGGRVLQQLFAKHPHGDITVSRAMETLSPQKLFRRDFVEHHGLRFPEGMVRLEDGMFVSRAYVLAGRIGFCAPKPLYFIAERGDGKNISARRIDPAGYVESVRTISGILRAGTADPAEADRLVLELFLRKGLRFYVPKRWLAMPPESQQAWVRLHREFLSEQVPERMDATVRKPSDAQLIALLREGDAGKVDAAVRVIAGLRHRSVLASVRRRGCLELLVSLAPAGVGDAGSLLGVDDVEAIVARAPELPFQAPRPGRLRAVERLYRLLAPMQGWRPVRGASRRLETAIVGEAPRLSLHLVGRTVGRRTVLPARWAGLADDGTPRYRFIVTGAVLRRFAGQTVDPSTSRSTESGVHGAPVRLAPGVRSLPREVAGVRPYRTDAGYVSLRVPGG